MIPLNLELGEVQRKFPSYTKEYDYNHRAFINKKITVRQNYTTAADQLVHVYSYNNDIHLQIFAHTAGIQLTLAIYKHLEPR